MLKHTFKEQARAAVKNAVSVVSSAALAFALVPAVAAPQPAQAIDYLTVPLTFTDYDTG